MADNTFVSLDNVGRVYLRGKRSLEVLSAVTCAVFPGARIAVVGPSGSGKSTLLHLIGGLDRPTAGSISWPTLGPKKNLRPQKVGFVFQMQSLLPALTVVENIELPLLLMDIKPPEARRAAIRNLEKIELQAIADKFPEELSGGQAQRVAMARALCCRPKLILADEPTGQLDHPTARRLFDVLLAAIENSDTALIVATHDPAIAGRMDTLWRLRHGRLEVQR